MKYEEYAGNGERKQQRSPSEIETDVETIRGEMSETLKHIEDRFSPRQLLDQVFGGAKRAGGESAGFARNLGSTIRDNPVPILLLAAGVGSLIAAQRRGHGSYGRNDIGGELRSGAPGESGRTGEMADRAREVGGEIRERGAEARDRAREAGHRARERTHEAGQRMRERATGARDRVRDAAQGARQRGTELFNEQPLVVIGLGLTAGALLGAALPVSDFEHRQVGPTRDRLVDRTAQVARERIQEVRETASESEGPEVSASGVTPTPPAGRLPER